MKPRQREAVCNKFPFLNSFSFQTGSIIQVLQIKFTSLTLTVLWWAVLDETTPRRKNISSDRREATVAAIDLVIIPHSSLDIPTGSAQRQSVKLRETRKQKAVSCI